MKALLQLLIPLGVVFTFHASGDEIQVRVINSKTAQPKQLASVEIVIFAGPGTRSDLPARKFRAMTDSSGLIRFSITPKTEPRLLVIAEDMCSPALEFYDVSTVIQSGVVGRNNCWNKSKELHQVGPHAGEIVVFRDRMTFWQVLHHFGEEF